MYIWKWLLTELLIDNEVGWAEGQGWCGRWPEALWGGFLTFAQSLKVSLLKWTHPLSPHPAEYRKLNCAFPTPILSATRVHAHCGSSPLPSVPCMEPAHKASEVGGTREEHAVVGFSFLSLFLNWDIFPTHSLN